MVECRFGIRKTYDGKLYKHRTVCVCFMPTHMLCKGDQTQAREEKGEGVIEKTQQPYLRDVML